MEATIRRSFAAATRTTAVVGLLAIAASAPALEFDVQVTNSIGPLTEVGDTNITVYLTPTFPGPVWGAHFRCGTTTAQRQGQQIHIYAILDPGEPTTPSTEFCQTAAVANLGPLNPAAYEMVAQLTLPDRSSVDIASAFAIAPRGNKCNADPILNRLTAVLANKTPDQFREALATDPDYRALLGDIAYLGSYVDFPGIEALAFPPLDDPVRVLDRLQRSGEFKEVDRIGRLCFSPGPPDAIGTAVEYYNTVLDHYFFTADAKEQAAIDSGAVGVTWIRTGKSFLVTLLPSCPIADETGVHLVYRFAGEPNIGPNSHFFTVSLDECAVVRDRRDWHWSFEGVPFWASEPVAGACPAGRQPLYRAFNNGKGGDPNHRYSIDHTVIDAMVAKGWIDEGARMCVRANP